MIPPYVLYFCERINPEANTSDQSCHHSSPAIIIVPCQLDIPDIESSWPIRLLPSLSFCRSVHHCYRRQSHGIRQFSQAARLTEAIENVVVLCKYNRDFHISGQQTAIELQASVVQGTEIIQNYVGEVGHSNMCQFLFFLSCVCEILVLSTQKIKKMQMIWLLTL